MAVTTAVVGRIDVPPQQIGQAGQPTDLACWVVDVTLGANTDYVNGTGLDLTTAQTAAGVAQINACQLVSIRTTAGAWKQALGGSTTLVSVTLDSFTAPAAPKLRIFVAPTAGGTYVEATGATHFVNGDIIRLMIFGV